MIPGTQHNPPAPPAATATYPLGRTARAALRSPTLSAPPPVIAYFFTTFPKDTETFLQREVAAMQGHGVNLRLFSIWGGGGTFRGLPVARFNKWRLLTLFWLIPYESARRPRVLLQLLRGLFTRRAPSWINFWENMLGAGFACVHLREFRRNPPALIHGAWGGAPATAAWLLWRADGHPFTAGAHAYDIFEHGGDWWLKDKLEHATFIHTSTEMARRALIERGLPASRILCIRRGLDRLPELKPLRQPRRPLRLVCVARLVEKKGLDQQLRIYGALAGAGVPFLARIIGDGPLRLQLEELARELDLAGRVTFTGHLSTEQVWEQLDWADVLLHTGVIAPSGDRDGLPNVIPEAMSAGVLVVTSPVAATTEAIADEVTGLVADVAQTEAWIAALRRLATDDALAEQLRRGARAWVEENFDAHKNAGRLLLHFETAMATR
jgi:colanic acid/amylovoran biosynthesis glycosyltransferase